MTKKPSFEDGVRVSHARIIKAIDERIVIARYGGSDLADAFIDLKNRLPSVDQILSEAESE
jgi:hypothetical protein